LNQEKHGQQQSVGVNKGSQQRKTMFFRTTSFSAGLGQLQV
jgi:hypothetical protein